MQPSVTSQLLLNEPWKESEDSFLKHCCEITKYNWGTRYYWPANVDNPKLNFVRITDPEPLSRRKIEKIASEHKSFFEDKNLTFNIKVAENIPIENDAMKLLKHVGNPLCYFKISVALTDIDDQHHIRLCQNESDLENWWLIYSTFPTREEKLKSPFYPVVKKAFKQGTEFYLMDFGGQPVSTMALDHFDGNLNVWGCSTRPDWQQKGLYKKMSFSILKNLNQSIFLQTNMGNPLQLHYKSTSAWIMTENRYVMNGNQ